MVAVALRRSGTHPDGGPEGLPSPVGAAPGSTAHRVESLQSSQHGAVTGGRAVHVEIHLNGDTVGCSPESYSYRSRGHLDGLRNELGGDELGIRRPLGVDASSHELADQREGGAVWRGDRHLIVHG